MGEFFTKENDYELFLAEIKERNYIAYFSQLSRLIQKSYICWRQHVSRMQIASFKQISGM